MNIMEFKVCSQNLGNTRADHMLVDKFVNPHNYQEEGGSPSLEYYEELLDRRETAEKVASESLKNIADVYCFQEALDIEQIGNELNRPLFYSLHERNFEFIYNKNEQLSVAIDKNKFSNIQVKAKKNAFIIATAEEKSTKKIIAFASVWAAGFPLYPNDVNDKNHEAKAGDDECKMLLAELDKLNDKTDMQVVMGDLNVTVNTYKPRLDLFTDKNFTMYKTDEFTEVNPKDKGQEEREIDFAFVRETKKTAGFVRRIFNFFQSLFFQTSTTKGEAYVPGGFEGWNPEVNGSDHKPILLNVRETNEPAYFSRFLALFQTTHVKE